MTSALNFHLFQPQGKLSPYIQGVWSAALADHAQNEVRRLLLGDACSGISFVIKGEVKFKGVSYAPGIIFSPTSKSAQTISLMPGAELAGIRLQSGAGYGLLGRHIEQPTAIERFEDFPLECLGLFQQLKVTRGHYGKITKLYLWIAHTLKGMRLLPEPLSVAFDQVKGSDSMTCISEQVSIGQRQLERQFKRWTDLTPKHYQRIWRVKHLLEYLKNHTDVSLAELALKFGFSDQAHMQREVKKLADITPKAFVSRYQ